MSSMCQATGTETIRSVCLGHRCVGHDPSRSGMHLPWEQLRDQVTARRQIDANAAAEKLNHRPCHREYVVPRQISRGRENRDVLDPDHAGDAGARHGLVC